MGGELLNLDQVCYRYPQGSQVGPVTWQLREGECWAVLGANGVGKSTLLLLAAGLLAPSSGRRGAGDARLSILFQDPEAQLFCGSVREEVEYGLHQVGLPVPQVQAGAEQALRDFGLAGLASRSPLRLSGGEKRLLALASLLVVQPQVLLLDEPTSELDPRRSDWLTDHLACWADRERALVIATHHLSLAAALCRQALVLGEDGQVAAAGPVIEIVHNRELMQRANLVGRASL